MGGILVASKTTTSRGHKGKLSKAQKAQFYALLKQKAEKYATSEE